MNTDKLVDLFKEEVDKLVNEAYEKGKADALMDGKKRPKSSNEQRAELIGQSKSFVEGQKERRTTSRGHERIYISPGLVGYYCDADFVVNEDKKTVVCLLRAISSRNVKSKGIAKCHPDEVFNADIGKAIALARAFGKDVPEQFLNAVQPDQVVVGMTCVGKSTGRIYNVKTVKSQEKVIAHEHDGTIFNGHFEASQVRIISDTNAEYEVTTK